jgi:putative hydrolase
VSKLKFVLDVHCHTVLSGHAYSTLAENAAHAASIGMPYIGVSDHAPGMPAGAHLYNFTNLWCLPEEIHGVRVFKGAECNIMNTNGDLDLPDSVLAKLDFVIASLHRGTFPPQNRDTHTRALINAMEHNPYMHILGHPGCRFFDIDIPAVIEAAARTSTIIEINNQSLNPNSYRFKGQDAFLEILHWCKEFAVPVLASSDAHFCTAVGELSRAREVIEKAGISENQVLNTDVELFLSALKKKKDRGASAPLPRETFEKVSSKL